MPNKGGQRSGKNPVEFKEGMSKDSAEGVGYNGGLRGVAAMETWLDGTELGDKA